jgi:hypothetical protein
MADGRAKALQALRRLIKSKRVGDDAWNIIDRLRSAENPDSYADRSAALICGVILDQALQEAISTHFVPLGTVEKTKLFDGDHEREAILGSYYSRIYVGYALRIFGARTLQDLNTIRSIRNAFAHFHGASSAWCPQSGVSQEEKWKKSRHRKLSRMPSGPEEFHPEPLTDPDLILSHHPARVTARRLPPSAEISGSSRGITQLAQAQRR